MCTTRVFSDEQLYRGFRYSVCSAFIMQTVKNLIDLYIGTQT